MYKTVLIIFYYYCVIARVKADFIQVIPNRNNREIMVDAKSENGVSNRISKTFENILKNLNVSTLDFEGQFTTEGLQNKIIQRLMNGTADELREIPRQDLMDSLWIINKLHLPVEKQLSVWHIIKGENQINELKRDDLENLSDLLFTISEMDLINLNVTDDGLIDFLGTYKNFTSRQLGILAYSLKLENETDNNLQNIKFINKVKGVLCGFGGTYLSAINPESFKFINASVFQNLWGCDKKQLKALLEIAQHPKAYGPISTWNKIVVSKLGFVVTAMEPNELKQIRADSVQDIITDVVEKFQDEQLKALTKEQINNMNSGANLIGKSVRNNEKNQQSGNTKNQAKIIGVFISVLFFLI